MGMVLRCPKMGFLSGLVGWQRAALRAVIKCVEDRKLAAEFPPEALHRRLEQLERARADKSATANKRTRGGGAAGPMPPAKSGRRDSFPAAAAPPFLRSPSAHSPYHSPPPLYLSERPPVAAPVYGAPAGRSPQAFSGHPLSYSIYGCYAAAPYQQAFYR